MIQLKKLKQYQCEICNTVYNSENECQKCETAHNRIKQCIQANYNAYKNNGAYPKNIIIEFENGIKAKYDYTSEIRR